MRISLRDCKSALMVLVLVSFSLDRTNGCLECLESGWDFLTEELFPSLCPLLSSTLKELFSDKSTAEEVIPKDLIADCLKRGRDLSKAENARGNKLVKGGATLDPYPPTMANFFFGPLPKDAKKGCRASHEMLAATKVLQMKICACSDVTPNTFMAFLENQVIKASGAVTTCKPFTKTCTKEKYRSYDGTCNNLDKPGWGRKLSQYTRISPVRYADGIYSMPVAKSGRPLPSPREITTKLFSEALLPSKNLNYLNMQWAQFVIHDMMMHLTEVTDEGGINCCEGYGTGVLPPDMMNKFCIPIEVPEDDPFYQYYGIRCLNLVRSLTTPRDDCSLGYAEQVNGVTSYIDASMLYGVDKTQAMSLRTKKGGRLREEVKKKCKRGYLPSVSNKLASCDIQNTSQPCYLSGDVRVNQLPPLALMHTLFLREHNRVAAALCRLNPKWSDEKLYQEARRIVIAIIQHIMYQEWLPMNLGEGYVRYYRISPSTLFTRDYSPAVNPGVINGVSAAALRALHILVPDSFLTCPNQRATYSHRLSDYYQNPSILEETPSSIEAMVRGLVSGGEAAASGARVTPEISRYLFRTDLPWGLDLAAIDLQRGRDHGIGSYNDFREVCGLRRARSFQELCSEIPQDSIKLLSKIYECVDDIDFYIGGIMERPVQGSLLGPTLQCVIAEQFYRTRIGDRFFYDNGGMSHSFSSEQLRQLKKASMARVICDNTDINYIQRRAFERDGPNNPQLSCDNIPCVDLSAWKKC